MALSISVFSNGNSRSKTISVDFDSKVLASSNSAAFSSEQKHFFKISTSAKDEDNLSYAVRIIENESQLALNETHWASWDLANAAGVAVTDPYPNIKYLILDNIYDIVNGREANQNGSAVAERAPLKY